MKVEEILMSTTTDQIERLTRDLVISKVAEDLKECKSLEDFERIRDKYVALSEEIPVK